MDQGLIRLALFGERFSRVANRRDEIRMAINYFAAPVERFPHQAHAFQLFIGGVGNIQKTNL